MSFNDITFNKDNLEQFLRELGKTYRKLGGKSMPAEIVLIGGAAVLVNYGFRDMTYDVDAIIISTSAMKDAINQVRDRFNLPNGWLNSDFTKTKSYSSKIREYSIYYKTFSNVLTVRIIAGEYLLAMKLMSGRKYKNDLSDVIGILAHHKQVGAPMTMDKIKTAVENLYGKWEELPISSRTFIEQAMEKENYMKDYNSVRTQEAENKIALQEFEERYPRVLSKDNLDEILQRIGEIRNSHFHFRSIHQDEIDQAVAIEQICFPPHEACSEKSMTERIKKAPELFLVAVDKETGKIAGFLNGLSTNEDVFRDEFFTDANLYEPEGANVMLLGLDVLPEYRGRGLARELVSQYAQRERKNRRSRLILTCLDDKVEMYKKMGFQDNGMANSTWGDEEWHEMSLDVQPI